MCRETMRQGRPDERSGNALSVVRRSSDDHPMLMLGAIVSALFIWAFAPSEQVRPKPTYEHRAPISVIHDASTTRKTSRLPARRPDSDCVGQVWGSESLECLTMIARENGATKGKIRVVVAAMPAGLATPNVF